MSKYRLKEHSYTHSEVIKSIRDKQLASNINTSSTCLIEKFIWWEQNYVEIVLRSWIEFYPENFVDKFTFYSTHRFIIIDDNRYFFQKEWEEVSFDIFTDLYVACVNKANSLFRMELQGVLIPEVVITNKQETKEIARRILDVYFSNPKNHEKQ